jgi:transposase
MVDFVAKIGKTIQLLYYPPYHSKYNPIEHCWGILELHWNGAKLVNLETMLSWARSMTWKGLHPNIHLNQKCYEKGISLNQLEMKHIESC